jgi:AcrR family transcriptional regulator
MPQRPRDRYRDTVRRELLEHAWTELDTVGVEALSLAAVADRLGVSTPALYRYVGSRDELISELRSAALQELAVGLQLDAADGATSRSRLAGIATSLRLWATSYPYRYLLVYGPRRGAPPAPADASAAEDVLTLIASTFATPNPHSDPNLTRNPRPKPAPTADARARAVTFWTRLHGVLALEHSGHLHALAVDATEHYDIEVAALLDGRD